MDLARRDGLIVEIGAQLQEHQALLRANVQLQRVFENPSIDIQVKANILTTLFERTQPVLLLRRFLLLLVAKDRMRQLDSICMQYARMADEELHRIVAQVTTAVDLDAQQRQAVAQKIAATTQRDVVLETQVDPAILGGLIVRINNIIVDGSLRGQLARIHQVLREG